jgi:isopentenyl diphosphate isomerase/L-lactate dehydrogenase-like FMN-dependent dehydrogenase
VPVLAALNRAGFLTLASQPGTAAGVDGCEQRAFASGFCRAADARALRALGARCFTRGAAGRAGVAVSRRAGRARVLAGHNAFEDELELFRPALGGRALAELERSAYWSIWDPVWGREEWLWRRLARVWS